ESWKSPVRPLTVASPPPVSSRVVPVPAQLPPFTLPPSVSNCRAPLSPLAVRSPPPVSTCKRPARLATFTLPPAADRVTPLEKPDAVRSPPLLDNVTWVCAGTSRLALTPQSPLMLALQFRLTLALVDVVDSLMLGRTRPYRTVPVSRAVPL